PSAGRQCLEEARLVWRADPDEPALRAGWLDLDPPRPGRQEAGDEVRPFDEANPPRVPVVGDPERLERIGATQAVRVEVEDGEAPRVSGEEDERRAGHRRGVDAQGRRDRPRQPRLARPE